ncbi:hypothetical protein IV49_GL000623 [Kandleria vitulina DSM 20405]|jgi:hypothetical protein|uniref:Uncharacterized protein n=2 Tax=Coprobacillaceae TaxID=2810280 RepID=A0A0R2HBE3_9FIRM|nr:hypothetical protein IV49_GL000623 [Kandleria vitulina DSM 20405]
MEIIFSLLFFSVAGSICVQLFIKSHIISQETKYLSNANMMANNIAETYRAHTLTDHYPYDKDKNIYFDNNWILTNSDNAVFVAHLTFSDNMLRIEFIHDGDSILSLKVRAYNQRVVNRS